MPHLTATAAIEALTAPPAGRPLRILLVTDNYTPNRDGVTTSVVSLAQGLTALGQEVAVLAPRARGTYGTPGTRTFLAPAIRAVGDYHLSWATPRSVRALAEEFGADLVHVHTLGPLGLAAAAGSRRSGTACVLTWHTDLLAYCRDYPAINLAIPLSHILWSFPGELPRAWRSTRRSVAAALRRRGQTEANRATLAEALAYFDHVIAPSHKAAGTLPCERADQRVHFVPSAEISAPAPPEPAAAEVLARVGRRPVVVFVGRLSGEKNFETLLRSTARDVLRRCPDALLLAIGDGPLRQRFEALAADLGVADSVMFTGAVPNAAVRQILPRCTLLAQPSLTETQGLVLAEAASAGVPAVVLDRALDGLVEHGVTGYVADGVADFGSLIAALVLAPELRDRLGARAREATVGYTSERFAARVLEIYRQAEVSGGSLSVR
ncbi:glycosyltransferase [Phytomonospora sp. NPDC050363]|uniref:glycosyltransferase n=1 Tax=Phytomonospora sp. NPDC050363 TaxID=3155642 RepID=UPI0033FBDAC2